MSREAFEKKVVPGFYKQQGAKHTLIYINFDGRRLSISGDDALGSGHIDMHMDKDYLDNFEYMHGWTKEKLEQLLAAWKKWHLNDMNAGCIHTENLDTQRKVQIVKLRIKGEYAKQQNKLKKNVESRLKVGDKTQLKDEDLIIYGLEYNLYCPGEPEYTDSLSHKLKYYDVIEIKTEPAIHVSFYPEFKCFKSEYEFGHPDAILCRPCEVCGYKWGTEWLYREVPEDVLDWLRELNDNTEEYNVLKRNGRIEC